MQINLLQGICFFIAMNAQVAGSIHCGKAAVSDVIVARNLAAATSFCVRSPVKRYGSSSKNLCRSSSWTRTGT